MHRPRLSRPALALVAGAALLCESAAAQSTAGIVRLRNRAQLPIAEFYVGNTQYLLTSHVLPGQSVDLPMRSTGTLAVQCKVGYRKGTFVDVIFPRHCEGTVTVSAGTVTVYDVPRITPARVLSHMVVSAIGGDPAFGGAGVTPAEFKAPYRNSAGQQVFASLLFTPAGDWAMYDLAGEPVKLQGKLIEVSWPEMSTKFSVSLGGKWTLNIDRPYISFILPTGPPLTGGMLKTNSLLTYSFCGFISGPVTSWYPSPSGC